MQCTLRAQHNVGVAVAPGTLRDGGQHLVSHEFLEDLFSKSILRLCRLAWISPRCDAIHLLQLVELVIWLAILIAHFRPMLAHSVVDHWHPHPILSIRDLLPDCKDFKDAQPKLLRNTVFCFLNVFLCFSNAFLVSE
jgi:hypothetical protein